MMKRASPVKKRVFSLLVGVSILLTGFAGCLSTGSRGSLPENDTSVFYDIPADKIAATLSPGWNLGNQLEGVKIVTDAATGISVTYPSETGYMATKISPELIHAVKEAGFKFVRIPVSYFAYIDDADGYRIKAEWLARIKEVVDMCLAEKLYCMLNMHGDGYTTIKGSWLLCAAEDQAPILEKYATVWRQVAETFRDYDESLLLESMNEEFDGKYDGIKEAAYENINAYNEVFVKTVRATGGNNARRWLLVPGWNTNIDQTADGFGTPGHFRLPKDDRLIVSLHYYDPWGFCGGENGTATQWGSFAAKPDRANGTEVSMAKQFNKIRDVFTSKGIPVILGEWGSIDKSQDDPDNPAYRAYFARKFCENAKRIGAVPVIWDNGWNGKYGFALFDRGQKADDQGNIVPGTVKISQPGIIDAIMGVFAAPATAASQARITLDQARLEMQPGATAILNAEILKGDGTETVAWSSSDETVAVVWDGVVKASSKGECTIIASLPNGKSAKCALKVSLDGGVQARVYLFEGAGWSSVKSEPLILKGGTEKEYDVRFNASKLVLSNIAALYIKDVEVEENHAPASEIDSCLVTVDLFSINGTSIPLINNEGLEAVNGKRQLDLPLINEWNPDIEMVGGFPSAGHRDITMAVKGLKIDENKNEVRVKFRTLAAGAPKAAKKEAPKPVLDADKTYHAYLCVQAADSWVFRNSYGSNSYGGETEQFKNGLFDTDDGTGASAKAPGTIVDADITKADIEAGKTFSMTLTGFDLSDKANKAKSFNMAMVSTDIPYGLVDVVSAKLFFDGKQVNLSGDKDVFITDLDRMYTIVYFINIWNSGIKTFGYQMPVDEIKMEITLQLKP
jgi:endoglucanase